MVKVQSAVGPDFGSVLAAAQAGAEWAFDRLYHQMTPRLLRYLASQAPGAADDLVAQTWMGAARNLHGFAGDEDAFRAWTFQIAHRQLVQHWRERARDWSVPTDPAVLPDRRSERSPEDRPIDDDATVRAARRVSALLPGDQAQVVVLRILGDLGVEQVAKLLGKRPGTVRVLQHRALRKLAAEEFSADL